MMRVELEQIHERMDRLEEEVLQNNPIRQPLRHVVPENRQGEVEDEEELEEFDYLLMNQGRFRRGNREARMGTPRRDDDLGSIKVKIPFLPREEQT